ncbi:hypothetical protein N9L68_00605 [bacterium]|nr:hypothetical protein [bacterium]
MTPERQEEAAASGKRKIEWAMPQYVCAPIRVRANILVSAR